MNDLLFLNHWVKWSWVTFCPAQRPTLIDQSAQRHISVKHRPLIFIIKKYESYLQSNACQCMTFFLLFFFLSSMSWTLWWNIFICQMATGVPTSRHVHRMSFHTQDQICSYLWPHNLRIAFTVKNVCLVVDWSCSSTHRICAVRFGEN